MRLPRFWAGFKAWLLDWRAHALTLLVFLLVYAGIHGWQTRAIPSGAAPVFAAPAATAQALGAIELEDWRARHPGRAVALHFWAEWCPICRLEEGSITALRADWPVLTVAMQSGEAARVKAVLRQRGLPWQAAVDADGSLSRRYGLGAVPAFIVLDAQGRIRFAELGYTSEAGMRLRLWWADTF